MADPAPLRPRPEVLDFLLTRRSRPAKTLAEPGPSRDDLMTLLTAAVRCPDHGKLEPWRFVVIAGEARARAAEAARERAVALSLDPSTVDKTAAAFTQGAVIVAVIGSPKVSDKIPTWEQEFSMGALCLSLLNATLAAGWGANWLTGPMARDRDFLTRILGCGPAEFVAGFIHIGTETVVPSDRPRPDVEALTTWL